MPRRTRKILCTMSLAAAALVLAACSSTGSSGAGGSAPAGARGSGGSAIKGKTVTFIIYADQSTPFFTPVVNGAQAAAAIYGLKLDVEYSNSDDSTQNNQIETAVASGTNALAVSIPSNTAFTKSVCAAQRKGIPVVAFNVTATAGPVLNCVLSYVGQDFSTAGYLIAQKLIADAHLRHGAQVFCPVEDPTAVYAAGRAAGANRALAAIGAKCNVVTTGFDLGNAQTTEVQYLLGHRSTAAILALGQVPLQVAPSALKSAHTHLPVAGFDLSSQISTAIENGSTLATVEQQPYLQGYDTVMQLALRLEYGLTPSSVNTGNAIIDKANVAKIAALAGKVY
jgi:simple sugar transport system substrate-binding protein